MYIFVFKSLERLPVSSGYVVLDIYIKHQITANSDANISYSQTVHIYYYSFFKHTHTHIDYSNEKKKQLRSCITIL